MKLSPFVTRWMLNLFPPLFFNRIRIKTLSPDFTYCLVQVKKSFLNTNLQKSIFGGTIFSAGDPFQAIIYWQYFAHQGISVQAWLKKAHISYRQPAFGNLKLEFVLTESDIAEAKSALDISGRFEKWHEIPILTDQGDLVAVIKTLVHLRLTGDTHLLREPNP